MKHGNNFKIYYFLIVFFFPNIILAEEKILSTPLINLNQIQPSFEVSDDENESLTTNNAIKENRELEARDKPRNNYFYSQMRYWRYRFPAYLNKLFIKSGALHQGFLWNQII